MIDWLAVDSTSMGEVVCLRVQSNGILMVSILVQIFWKRGPKSVYKNTPGLSENDGKRCTVLSLVLAVCGVESNDSIDNHKQSDENKQQAKQQNQTPNTDDTRPFRPQMYLDSLKLGLLLSFWSVFQYGNFRYEGHAGRRPTFQTKTNCHNKEIVSFWSNLQEALHDPRRLIDQLVTIIYCYL